MKTPKRPIIHKTETGSTNADLKALLRESRSPLYTVLSADRQTDGRGRLGRKFFSPEGGLYFSVPYPVPALSPQLPCLTLLAGLSVSRALEALLGVQTEIKWPNDVYLNGRKLAGILTELLTEGGRITAVVGIGVNLSETETEIPGELRMKMTSLAREDICVPEKKDIMERIVTELDQMIYEKDALNSPDYIKKEAIPELNRKSLLFGKKVKYKGQAGIGGEISESGALTLLFENEKRTVTDGEVLLDR